MFNRLPPRLPKGTAARISAPEKVGMFWLSAHVENNQDLKPWFLQSEVNRRALE
jgi:hypothetical protein